MTTSEDEQQFTPTIEKFEKQIRLLMNETGVKGYIIVGWQEQESRVATQVSFQMHEMTHARGMPPSILAESIMHAGMTLLRKIRSDKKPV